MTWWGVGISAAVQVGSAYFQNKNATDAAGDAADAQFGAAQGGINEQKRQFDSIQKLLAPYIQNATGTPGTPSNPGGQFDAQAYLAANPDVAQNWVGHGTENDPTGAFVHYQMFGKNEGRAFPTTAATAATAAKPGSIDLQGNLIGLNGDQAQQEAIANIQNGPEFKALNDTGQTAILQNASATGGLRGGNVQGALAQFSPQLLAKLIQQRFSQLGDLSQQGLVAGGAQAGFGSKISDNITKLLGEQGAAGAGQAIAGGKADSSMISGIGGAIGGLVGSIF